MEARLSALREGARRAIEETGANTCFAAYGFLEWYEAPNSDRSLYAPLVLQPVEIERASFRGRWRYSVRANEDDTVINITLADRLRRDFGAELPLLSEGEAPEGYFARVEEAVQAHPRWRVRRFLTFGLFSFGRLAMWRDLDPARWPSAKTPETNPVVVGLLAGGGGGGGVEAPEYDVDSVPVRQTLPPEILPADSSQLSAILDAVNGQNLAIKGPPGTGKSQTIANLIAAAIGTGKRVLFLAEKMAALNVVKSRLDMAGLGPFVLELHSTRAKKKDVLEGLGLRLEQQGALLPPPRIAEERREAEELRRRLNGYATLLNTSFGATGKTIQEILWSAQRHSLPTGLTEPPVLEQAGQMTVRDLENTCAALRDLEESARVLTDRWVHADKHPWAWVNRLLSPFEADALYKGVQDWHSRCCDLGAVVREVPESLGIPAATEDDLSSLSRMLRSQLSGVPTPQGISGQLLVQLDHEGVRAALAEWLRAAEERRLILTAWRSDFAGDVAALVPEGVAALAEDADAANVHVGLAGETLSVLEQASQRLREWRSVQQEVEALAGRLGVSVETRSEALLLLDALSLLQTTPRSVLAHRHPNLLDERERARLQRIANELDALRERRRLLGQRYRLQGLPRGKDLRAAARRLRGSGLLYRFTAPYRQARNLWRALAHRPSSGAMVRQMARELEELATYSDAVAALSGDRWLAGLLGQPLSIDTKLEPLLDAVAFAGRVDALCRDGHDLGKRLRRFLVEGSLDEAERVVALATKERIESLRAATATPVGETHMRLEEERLRGVVEAAQRLADGLRGCGAAPHLRLERLRDCARDLNARTGT